MERVDESPKLMWDEWLLLLLSFFCFGDDDDDGLRRRTRNFLVGVLLLLLLLLAVMLEAGVVAIDVLVGAVMMMGVMRGCVLAMVYTCR